jgi:hypothetical protein
VARNDGNLKIKNAYRTSSQSRHRAQNVRETSLKIVLKGNTVSNPHQGAATSLATKAIYMLFATILLVFVAMLALTVLHP